MKTLNDLKNAIEITSMTLVGYLADKIPYEMGNCFSLKTEESNYYRILNFNLENLEHLLEKKIISFPITILPLSDSHAVIVDSRIPNEFYSNRFCETCTPRELLPMPQRIKQLLQIQKGIREEREIDFDGKKSILVKINVSSPVIVYAPFKTEATNEEDEN